MPPLIPIPYNHPPQLTCRNTYQSPPTYPTIYYLGKFYVVSFPCALTWSIVALVAHSSERNARFLNLQKVAYRNQVRLMRNETKWGWERGKNKENMDIIGP